MGLPLHTPLGDFIPKPHLRFAAVESSFYAPTVRQVTLRSLILAFYLLHIGVTFGALIRETRIVAQALLAISDFRHAESRTAGA